MTTASTWLFDKYVYVMLAGLFLVRVAMAAGADPDIPGSFGQPPKCFICSAHHDKGWPCTGFVLNPIR